MEELAPNTALSHYRIISKLGAGGMGEVYLAQDTKLDRKVALKILPGDVASNRDRMERFVREAKSAAALNHPNIAHVYEIGESKETQFIAMEFIDGETLREKIHRDRVPLSKLLKYLNQVAEGLAKAHAIGIVHRDLKPDNIMITRDDYAKVLDFGLAKLIEPQRSFGPSDSDSSEIATAVMQQHSMPGTVMGTIGYMSPEQASGRINEIDHRSDIFSFGCILFEAATGQKAFEGKDALDSLHKIVYAPTPQLKDANPLAPDELQRVVRRCLAKEPERRYQSIKEVAIEIDDLRQELKSHTGLGHSSQVAATTQLTTSGATTSDEGFWVAVLPFKFTGSSVELTALAEGLSEDIVTGLSRFSYLRVIARGSTLGYANRTMDLRTVGKELGARYILEGSLRLAGSVLRIAVQLVDASTGAHLWAETYDRSFQAEAIFALQDDLVPKIVSTVADQHGILPHTMSEALRNRDIEHLRPYEIVVRGFGYYERVTAQEHARLRAALERAVEQAPSNADCWAMLAIMYCDEHKFGFNPLPNSLGRALSAAQRAVEASVSNPFAYEALAQALFFRREFDSFRNAAERAIALNPLDGATTAFMGLLIAYAGDWERGCSVAEQATKLNPHHPGWYWSAAFWGAYRKSDYRSALSIALKFNMPGFFYHHVNLAIVNGQLGDREAASKALQALLVLKPDFALTARDELGKWVDPELVEHAIDGLRKAGLQIADSAGLAGVRSLSAAPLQTGGSPVATTKEQSASLHKPPSTTSLLVLPFTNTSADEENEYFCDGLTEELISDLSKVRSLRVISRNSAMRLKGTTKDLKTIASDLNVRYVLDGSVRKAGSNLRVSVQLIEAESDASLWSEKYSGTLEDIFEMQESVSRSIVEALKITLSADEERQIAERPIGDVRAYDLYLQARAKFLQGNPAALHSSIELLKQGLEIIGENELLYAALGYSYYFTFRWISKLDENYLRLANECMEKTFALNPSSSHGFSLKGLLSYSQGDIGEAIQSLKKALAIQPDNTEALFWLSINSSYIGNAEEATKYADRVRAIDPLLPSNTVIKAVAYIYNGEFSKALPWIERAVEMDTSSTIMIWTAAIVDAWCGRPAEAIAHVDKLAQMAPNWVYTQHGLFLKHALLGEKELALQYDSAELTKEAEHDCHFALHVAHCFALIHEKDKALDLLELAVRTGMVNYSFLGRFDPLLENLRHEDRFKALMSEAKQLFEKINGSLQVTSLHPANESS